MSVRSCDRTLFMAQSLELKKSEKASLCVEPWTRVAARYSRPFLSFYKREILLVKIKKTDTWRRSGHWDLLRARGQMRVQGSLIGTAPRTAAPYRANIGTRSRRNLKRLPVHSNHCRFSGGLMVRDARHGRAPHHEGLRPHPSEASRSDASRRMKPGETALASFSHDWIRCVRWPCRFRSGGLMHDFDRAAEQIAITLGGVSDIGGHREFGSAANQV